jgi:Heat induced stress protein YflT domain
MATQIDSRDAAERRTVAGLFPDRARAEQAIDALKAAGFTGDQIGVALRDRTAQGVLIEETGTQVAEEAATTGALGGGLLGGLTGLLIGIGALVIPGLGPVVAGGMLATAFGVAGGTVVAGVGIGAAAGGVLGALAGLGMPDLEARYFETGFRAGRVLVTVEAGARMLEAMAILDRSGADTGPATGPGAIGG